jgi:hypothetical protein
MYVNEIHLSLAAKFDRNGVFDGAWQDPVNGAILK